MYLELLLRIGQIGALAARALIVHLQHMRCQTFRSCRLIIAEQADKRLCVCVQMTLEAPLVGTRPGAVAAGEAFLTLRFQQTRSRCAAARSRTGTGHRLMRVVVVVVVHNRTHMQWQHRTIVQLLLLELGKRHIGSRGNRLDSLHNAHAGRGGMSLCLQEGIINIHTRRIDGHITPTAGMMSTIARSAGSARRATATARGHMTTRLIDIVLQLTMHAQKVFLDVIGTIELLEAGVALKGFLILVDILVTCIQIPAICRVGAMGAGVTFHNVHAIRSGSGGCCLCLRRFLATAAGRAAAAATAAAVGGVGGR